MLDRDEAVEFRTEDDFSIFVLDRLRQQKPVRRADGAQKRLFEGCSL